MLLWGMFIRDDQVQFLNESVCYWRLSKLTKRQSIRTFVRRSNDFRLVRQLPAAADWEDRVPRLAASQYDGDGWGSAAPAQSLQALPTTTPHATLLIEAAYPSLTASDVQRTKLTGGPLRRRSPARGTSALSDGLGRGIRGTWDRWVDYTAVAS